MKKFWNFIRDETAPDARVLRLEGTIAEESWFDDDVTPALFKADLNPLPVNGIVVLQAVAGVGGIQNTDDSHRFPPARL